MFETSDTKSRYWPVIQRKINSISFDKPIRILDVGAGDCWLSNQIDLPTAEKYAMDIYYYKHDHSTEFVEFITNGNCHFAVADATRIPFPDGSFDVVISNEFVSHVSDIEKSISEQIRVLRKGGILIIIDSNIWNPYVIFHCFFENYFKSRGEAHLRGGLRWLIHRNVPFSEILPTKTGFKQFSWKDENVHSRSWWDARLAAFSEISYEIDGFWSSSDRELLKWVSNKIIITAKKNAESEEF